MVRAKGRRVVCSSKTKNQQESNRGQPRSALTLAWEGQDPAQAARDAWKQQDHVCARAGKFYSQMGAASGLSEQLHDSQFLFTHQE